MKKMRERKREQHGDPTRRQCLRKRYLRSLFRWLAAAALAAFLGGSAVAASSDCIENGGQASCFDPVLPPLTCPRAFKIDHGCSLNIDQGR